jgi:F0F1-type ATP synthase assembly protein I
VNWKPVIIFYVKTTSWIIFPLVIGLLLGKYVSQSAQSQALFFIFMMVGFGITCFGIYREVKEYKKSLEKNQKNNGNPNTK